MRLAALRIRDVRSLWGAPVEVPLGSAVTVLVGPNRSGTSNVAFALVAALDARMLFRPRRDLPRRRGGEPQVILRTPADGEHVISWDPDSGARTTAWRPSAGGHHLDGEGGAPTGPSGQVVSSRVQDAPRELLRRSGHDLASADARRELAMLIRDTVREVIPEVADVDIDQKLSVRVGDDLGSAIPLPEVRALVALALSRFLASIGRPPAATVVESPDAFLHPAGQAAVAALLLKVAAETDAPVVVTTTSPFVIPRVAETSVVAFSRDVLGRTDVVGSAAGDAAQARLLGGLLHDPGLANVLDRVGSIPADCRGVLIVEGGTDEAYLRIAARQLGREDVLDRVVVQPAGGAMAAAMSAIVLRAEQQIALVVLLDHDVPGRRARDTLTSRFGFERAREVVTYADVYGGHPPGVEAETLFGADLLRRFVAEKGTGASHGERVLSGVDHVDLTSSGKSAFVGWAREHATPEHLAKWSELFDLLDARFPR